jgi:hypothetical protein
LQSSGAVPNTGRATGAEAERLAAQFEDDPNVAAAALAKAVAVREILYAIFVAIALGVPPDGRAVERLVDACCAAIGDAQPSLATMTRPGGGRPWRPTIRGSSAGCGGQWCSQRSRC